MGKLHIAWCPCCAGTLIEERIVAGDGQHSQRHTEMQCAGCSRVIEIWEDSRGHVLRVPLRRPDVHRAR